MLMSLLMVALPPADLAKPTIGAVLGVVAGRRIELPEESVMCTIEKDSSDVRCDDVKGKWTLTSGPTLKLDVTIEDRPVGFELDVKAVRSRKMLSGSMRTADSGGSFPAAIDLIGDALIVTMGGLTKKVIRGSAKGAPFDAVSKVLSQHGFDGGGRQEHPNDVGDLVCAPRRRDRRVAVGAPARRGVGPDDAQGLEVGWAVRPHRDRRSPKVGSEDHVRRHRRWALCSQQTV